MACYNSCPLTLWSYNSYSIEPLAIAKAALRVCAIHLFVCLLLCLLVCRQNAYTKRFSQKLSNLELNIILSIDDHSYIHRLFKELILGPPKIEDGERVPSWKSLNRHAYANKKNNWLPFIAYVFVSYLAERRTHTVITVAYLLRLLRRKTLLSVYLSNNFLVQYSMSN